MTMYAEAAKDFQITDAELTALFLSKEPMHRALGRAIDNYATAKDTLLATSKSVQERMERLDRAVREGRSVNSLGELQSAGPALDVACAKYTVAAEWVKTLLATAPKPEGL